MHAALAAKLLALPALVLAARPPTKGALFLWTGRAGGRRCVCGFGALGGSRSAIGVRFLGAPDSFPWDMCVRDGLPKLALLGIRPDPLLAPKTEYLVSTAVHLGYT